MVSNTRINKIGENIAARGGEITPEEFYTAFEKAIMYVEYMNQNDDAPVEADDNIQIDQQLYNQY